MSPSQQWPLKRPTRGGYVGPMIVSCMDAAVRDLRSDTDADAALREAHFPRSPDPDAPMREGNATSYYRTVRELWPDQFGDIQSAAGHQAGHILMERQLPSRAQSLLRAASWTVSAWMLSRALKQHAWLFAGSADFEITDEMSFVIRGNPFTRGVTAQGPTCLFHARMFGTLYRGLVDSRLLCQEVSCAAAGDSACRFSFGLASEGLEGTTA